MADVLIKVTSDRFSAADLNRRLSLDTNRERASLRNLSSFIERMASGFNPGTCEVKVGPTKATATLTFTGAPSNDETFSLGNITFTAKTSGATGNEFNIGGSVTATALNVVAAVNGNATLVKFLTATSAAGVVTFTIDVPGDVGNAIELSEALTNATISGFVTVDTGDDGTEVNFTRN